ncbi:SH3 domain-containing protein [Patescibacteria group bacterium]|nr:SH3 domain-containing protein [Patescibacteria group bacterium]MBU0846358.1 SH3 domain-containing protein [Patescibacteria group bacterium]
MKKKSGRGFGCLGWLIILVVLVFLGNWVTEGAVVEIFEEITSEFSTSKYEAPRVKEPAYEEPAAVPVNYEPLVFERQAYYPIKNCAHSRLYVGDRVIVSLGGGSNGIRTEPDTHPSDNIIYRAPSGEGLWIIGGPECNWGWILWKVKTDSGYVGWTPESSGDEFWLTPIESESDMLTEIRNNPRAYEAYEQVSSTIHDSHLSESQKRDKIRVYQNTYGEEIVAWVIRLVPVYQGDGKFTSFNSWAQDFSNDYSSSSSSAPIDSDPVGSSLSIFFDPSVDNITEQLGLDSWFP